ncbi:hypothetical protein BDW59DRAFT_164042 [Aspergillus cavernicola]|uniref:Uncharacterized protein n=1 Tax=Aspergillus cavernicola TaxID=176166 RepID=A0ABR4I4S6_9EURO
MALPKLLAPKKNLISLRSTNAINIQYMEVAKAYVLGDKLLSPKLRNTAIDAMIEQSGILLVDMHVEHGSGEWIRDPENLEIISKPFLVDLSAALLDMDRYKHGLVKACKYHRDIA